MYYCLTIKVIQGKHQFQALKKETVKRVKIRHKIVFGHFPGLSSRHPFH